MAKRYGSTAGLELSITGRIVRVCFFYSKYGTLIIAQILPHHSKNWTKYCSKTPKSEQKVI